MSYQHGEIVHVDLYLAHGGHEAGWGLMCIPTCRTLIKTQDYLDVFARFKQKENIEAVERMLATHDELEYFERSQLGSIS